MGAIYDFTVKLPNGEETSLKEYEGKVLLIVNTASKCGLTPQFAGLQELYDKYKEKGFAVLGFPCSQFNNQEFENIEVVNKIDKLDFYILEYIKRSKDIL